MLSKILLVSMLLLLTACATAPAGHPPPQPAPVSCPRLPPLPPLSKAAAESGYIAKTQRWLSDSLAPPPISASSYSTPAPSTNALKPPSAP
ncbi:hypothetical protein D3C87_1855000 [compost metagenome]